MAGSSAQVTFAFLAKDLASGTIRGISKSLANVKENARNLGSALKTSLKIGAAAIAGIAAGAVAAAVSFTKAAIEDEAANNRLIAVLQARKLASEANLKIVDQLITKGAELAFTDDEVRAGIATATQFTNKFADAQKILATAQDLARAKNISLEEATSIVGKAYQGNTKGLKALGIETKKGAKGLVVLTAVSKKFGSSAAAYAETTEGKFASLKIAIDETKESVGGVFLNALKKVFSALQPYMMKFLSEIQKRLPDLEKFVDKIANDLVKNLPGYIAVAKREIPPLIKKFQDFFGEVVAFGKRAAAFLGKDGAVTGGLALIGAKIGGLKGAISGVLTKSFSDFGFGPFESLLLGTVSSAVIAGMTEGIAGQVTTKLIAAFALKMKLASTPVPGIPGVTPTPGGGSNIIGDAIKAGTTAVGAALGVGATGVGLALAGFGAMFVAQTAVQEDRFNAMKKGQDSFVDTLVRPWTWPGALGDIFRGDNGGADILPFLAPAFVDPMTAKYANGDPNARAFGAFNNPMTAKYSTPTFNVYVGAETVADAVVPVIARTVTTTPRGGR
jgi:hypothetical protein